MRLTRRVLINSVAFVVLGLLLAFILAVQVLPTLFGSTYSVYALFKAGGGVAENQEVTYRGVQVGRVGKMTLTADAVKIELTIESKYKIPKEGTRARVLFKSAVGEQFVDLIPQSESGSLFRDGDVIPMTMTSIPIQTEDLLRELDAVLRSIDPKALGSLVHSLGTGLTGHGSDLSKALKALDVLTTIGAARAPEVSGILENGADVQESFNSSSEDFVRATSALRTVLATLAAHRDDLAGTLSATKDLNTDLIHLLDSRRLELNTIIADLASTVGKIRDSHLSDVDKLLTFLGPFLNDATKAFDSPYFVFNLVANSDDPECRYKPGSRPGGTPRQVTQVAPKQPPVNVVCPTDSAASSTAAQIASMSPAMRIQLERVSWLQLFTAGY